MAHLDVTWTALFADVPADRLDTDVVYWEQITGAPAGRPTGTHDEFVPLRPADGEAVLWLQRVHRDIGGWHLDLFVPDLAAGVEVALARGARRTHDGGHFIALRSPTGLPFCVVREHVSDPVVAPARTWPGGRRSVVDQICIDVPALAFDVEAAFWADITGWERRRGTRPEFDRLVRPDALPAHFLLQRLGSDDLGGIRAHLDLAADDRAAETDRHVAAGGTVITRRSEWTVLRDPAGLAYCITDREPRG